MRHAEVCGCRDCGMARLNALMDAVPDGGKLAFAMAAIELSLKPFDADVVALPYPEISAAVSKALETLDLMCIEVARHAGLDGYMPDSISELEERMRQQLHSLADSWKRD